MIKKTLKSEVKKAVNLFNQLNEEIMANRVSISFNNDKMGIIPSFSFPPVLTCKNFNKCVLDCYALRMCYRRSNTAKSWLNNFKIWQNNPQAVEFAILNASVTSAYFRYFVGGDIPNLDFLKMMVKIANKVKTCKYLAFTKNYKLVNDYLLKGGKLPKNLKIVFSKWGKTQINNPFNLPTSGVIFKGDEILKSDKICGGNCANCICQNVGCWMLRNGEEIKFLKH